MKIPFPLIVVLVFSCSQSTDLNEREASQKGVNFIGNWSCGCAMEYENKDDYVEIEISDSMYWLVTEYTGPNCDIKKIITQLKPVSYFIRNDTLFAQEKDWYIVGSNENQILIKGEWSCERIFPTHNPSEWNDEIKEIMIEEFSLRRDSSNCP